MCDNGFSIGSWELGELPGFPGEAQASSTSQVYQRPAYQQGWRGERPSGAVSDCLVVHIAAFPVIWVGANVSLGRDRKQSVMYKI